MAKKQSPYFYGIIFVIVLVAIFLVSFLGFRHVGTVKYQGLTFTKERVGQIDVYHYYYLYEDKTGQLVQNNIYLRGDPRKDMVPVEGDNITYLNNKIVFVTINASALKNCSQSSIAIAEIAGFLANGGLRIKGASMENVTTEGTNTTYATCQRFPDNPVVQINGGDTTKISANKLCYNIAVASCSDVLPAAEKFIVQSVLDAKTNNT